MNEINLGIPPVKRILAPRSRAHRIMMGSIPIGGDAPILVQSMITTLIPNVGATLQRIAEPTAAGCDIIHVACSSENGAEALPETHKHSSIPVVADIYFQSRYVFQAIEVGCGVVRVNPGNTRTFDDQVKEIAKAVSDHGTALRVGVNAGSLDKHLHEEYGGTIPKALAESVVWEVPLSESVGFHDSMIPVKHHDPLAMTRVYRLPFQAGEWPSHLRVTEAGPQPQSTIKSAMVFGVLLSEGIGDAIRVSPGAPSVEEVKVGLKILRCLGLCKCNLEIVSYPSCGRLQMDMRTLTNEVSEDLKDITYPLRVTATGCTTNGPGEVREADLGVASGSGKGKVLIKGKVIKIVPESEIVIILIVEASRLGRELSSDSRSPAVEAFESIGAGNCP